MKNQGAQRTTAVENRALQEEIVQRSIYEEIVVRRASLQRVVAAIEKVAPTARRPDHGVKREPQELVRTHFIAALTVLLGHWSK